VAKTTIDGKTIEGVSVWIIYRSYAKARNKMIDDVINNKNTLVSSSCVDKNDNNNQKEKAAIKEAEKKEKAAIKEAEKKEKAMKKIKNVKRMKNKSTNVKDKVIEKKITNYFTKR
jgi:hypothetical protein